MSRERKRVESVRERDEKKRRERSEESEVRGREKVERMQNREKEKTFMTPSHALLFTKLPLQHFIKIFLLNN